LVCFVIKKYEKTKKGGGGGLVLFQNTMHSPLTFFYWNSFLSINEMKY